MAGGVVQAVLSASLGLAEFFVNPVLNPQNVPPSPLLLLLLSQASSAFRQIVTTLDGLTQDNPFFPEGHGWEQMARVCTEAPSRIRREYGLPGHGHLGPEDVPFELIREDVVNWLGLQRAQPPAEEEGED